MGLSLCTTTVGLGAASASARGFACKTCSEFIVSLVAASRLSGPELDAGSEYSVPAPIASGFMATIVDTSYCGAAAALEPAVLGASAATALRGPESAPAVSEVTLATEGLQPSIACPDAKGFSSQLSATAPLCVNLD